MTLESSHELLKQHIDYLEDLSLRALQKGLSNREFVTLLIDRDDPAWSALADYVMPNEDWQRYHQRGERPIVRSTVMAKGVIEYICEVAPGITSAFQQELSDQDVRVAVLEGGQASVYLIQPKPHLQDI